MTSSLYGGTGLKGPTGGSKGNKLAGYDVQQMQNFSPEQMQLFQSMFGQVSPDSYTGRLSRGDESLFGEMEAPALRQFSGLQGNLASRFSGMGGLGARRSSGFQNTASEYAGNFAQQLQSQRQGLQRQAIQDLMGMSSELLGQRPYSQYMTEPEDKKSWWQKMLGGSLPLIGAGVGGFFGGPAGASIGGKAGAAAGQAFF
jgi:hypothetical protein